MIGLLGGRRTAPVPKFQPLDDCLRPGTGLIEPSNRLNQPPDKFNPKGNEDRSVPVIFRISLFELLRVSVIVRAAAAADGWTLIEINDLGDKGE